jgi:hypothetical protein
LQDSRIFSLIAALATNYNKDKYYIVKHNPGISYEMLDRLPYYEFVELKMLVAEELKIQEKQAKAQEKQIQKQTSHKPSMPSSKVPKFRK